MAEKRSVPVSVRMSKSDLDRLTKAAKTLWPGAILTRSGIVLGLALLQADEVLAGVNTPAKTPPPPR